MHPCWEKSFYWWNYLKLSAVLTESRQEEELQRGESSLASQKIHVLSLSGLTKLGKGSRPIFVQLLVNLFQYFQVLSHGETEKPKCMCYSPLGLTQIDDIYVWKDSFKIILNMSNLPKELSRNWRLILGLNQVLIIMPPLSFFWISTLSERQEIKEIEQHLKYTFRDCACLKHPRL